MRTAVASTSLQTYDSLGVKAYLQPKELEVMELMNLGYGLTREQIAQELGWKEASVCGRVNSLVAKGLLIEEDGAKTSSGRPAKFVRIPRKKAQGELFQC